ncbi:hypothetical protein [Streptomyces sp. NPDC001759]
MTVSARFMVRHRWWGIISWIVCAFAGAFAAPRATDALSYDFGLPGRPGYETNQKIVKRFGSGGENAPVVLAVTSTQEALSVVQADQIAATVQAAGPGGRLVTCRSRICWRPTGVPAWCWPIRGRCPVPPSRTQKCPP